MSSTLKPHLMCTYLYDLSSKFHEFYEQFSVLNSVATEQRSRLSLIHIVAQIIKQGLDLLGIKVVTEM